jgi:hypothetical protein
LQSTIRVAKAENATRRGFVSRGLRAEHLFLFELGDPLRKPGHFPLRGIAVNDAFLGGADQSRFGFRHGGKRSGAITGSDSLLNFARGRTHARAARFIDRSPTFGLAGGFFGGFGIGHSVLNTELS